MDNVDDPGVGSLLSADANHFSLLTSRLQKWNDLVVVEVGLFTRQEALDFLHKGVSSDKSRREEDLERLMETLQYLPLAMKQAVACIESLDLSVKDYLAEFQTKSNAVLGLATDTEKTILTTWGVSIDKMMQKDEAIGRLALTLLRMISFLHPDKIPKQLFETFASDKIALNQAVELLRQYSLVKVHNGIIKIHRLVQETMRINLKEQGLNDEVLDQVLKVLYDRISVNPKNRTLATHMRTAMAFATEERHTIRRLKLQEMEAAVAKVVGQDFTGALVMQEACQEGYREARYGSETHRDFLLSESRLANIKWNVGQISSNQRRLNKVTIIFVFHLLIVIAYRVHSSIIVNTILASVEISAC